MTLLLAILLWLLLADDTGGRLKKDQRERGIPRIDLRFIHHRSAVRFGRRRMTVYIWRD